jgi:RHS repeat-associated protein
VTVGGATKYYYFGKQRVAMKVGSTVTYLHGDHLGSTSITTNSGGACTSAQWYYAYGNVRTPTPTTPCDGTPITDYTFTGQKRDASAGLMYYGARYYDTTLGRSISADTIVPSAGNPQSLNRYTYGANKTPLRIAIRVAHLDNPQKRTGRRADFNCDVVPFFYSLATNNTFVLRLSLTC